MEINELKKDKRVKRLLVSIEKGIKLEFIENKNEEGWGSKIVNDTAYIYYNECKYPVASLAHELLHIEVQIKGYRRIKIGASNITSEQLFNTLIQCLDNEIQHHKFYSKFLSLGFKKHQFFMDSDKETANCIRSNISKGFTDIIALSLSFFTIISSGGYIDENEKNEIKNELLNTNNGIYKENLLEVERILVEWSKSSNNFDAVPVIKNILLALRPEDNLTWFGFDVSERPPSQGFFVDEEFELKTSN